MNRRTAAADRIDPQDDVPASTADGYDEGAAGGYDSGYDGDQLDLEERHALRRVAGLSTELADVTEVEYRQLRLERVVLAGVFNGDLRDGENSLAELAALAETAGSQVLDALMQRRDQPDPGTFLGSGKAKRAARHRGRDRRRHRDLRRRAVAVPASRARGRRQGQGHRPHRADPGHLRPARPQPGGQGAGRAGPARVPAAAPAWLG